MSPSNEPGHPELNRILTRQIDSHGPVSFKWFMEQVLYHPTHGYYSSGRATVGRRGDFYTNVSVGKIYGELMAAQFEEMWVRMGQPMTFAIVEQGAHDGRLANDVLTWIQARSPRLFAQLTYWIVEPSETLLQHQQAALSGWPRNKVRWHRSLDDFEVGSLCGVHFSNELIDSLPVHLVVHDGSGWQEMFVDSTMKGSFRFVLGPLSNGRLREHLGKVPTPPADCVPYKTEVNLKALGWMEDVSRIMRQGYVLACDYGFAREQYYAPGRLAGTISVYYRHQRGSDPFFGIGDCDITAHVDFTSLAEVAEAHSLKLHGFCDQHHFLVGIGEERLMEVEYHARQYGGLDKATAEAVRQFRTLMHPSTMGLAFKYICFSKGLLPGEPLSGFRHAGDARAALGLPEPAKPQRKSEYDSFYDPF